jgi:hypothetical protein
MNTTHKSDPHQSTERKPMSPQRDDDRQRQSQAKPNDPHRQDHRDANRDAPHKK